MPKAETDLTRPEFRPAIPAAFSLLHSTVTRRWLLFAALALLAFLIRLPQLGERPMHTDESVNAFLIGKLLAGDQYRYDPQDRHGPLLYVVAEPLVKLLGAKNLSDLTETQLRLTPVLVGSAMVLVFGAGVEIFRFLPCLVAALLFALAPLPVYYSRYFIHETLFVAATLGLILAGWRTLQNPGILSAALTGGCAALMLACKETAIIHFFGLGTGLLCVHFIKPLTDRPPAKVLATMLVVFLVTTILLFTWFGQNWSGLTDLVRAMPRFAARASGEGHEKPFGYYGHLLDPLFILVFVAVAGAYAAICDAVSSRSKAGLFIAIYGLVVFLIYSAIPYKTPWLALNLWLPFSLLCGVGAAAFGKLLTKPAARWGAVLACGFFLVALFAQTKLLVFQHPADEKNPFAYAHTSEDLLQLPVRLAELAREKHIAQPRIAVVAADAWPLPWYLRKFSCVGYWQPGQAAGAADFFITTSEVPGPLAAQLKDFRPDFFGARPNVLLILWSPSATHVLAP